MKFNKKELIVEIATKHFAKYGYYATSLENIAKECDITKPAIYYHFKDKKSLYHHIINQNITNLNKNIEDFINLNDNPELNIIKYIEILSDFLSDNTNFSSVLAHEFANHGINFCDDSILSLSKILEILTKIINIGIEKNIFEIENPMVIQITIFSTLIMHQTTKPIRERVTNFINKDSVVIPEPSLNDFAKIFSKKIIKSIKKESK